MEKKIKHKLGIIVPYRDRKEQLDKFIFHMSEYLLTTDHTIIVVEQVDENDFNRGKLLNIGFNAAVKEGCDYVVFHDIDLLPIKADYSYADRPTHLIGEIQTPEGFDRTLFDEYFGGVTLFPCSVFQAINGYSNEFWGWGFEDDNLMLRCTTNKVLVDYKKVDQTQRYGTGLKLNGKDSFIACPNVFNSVRDFTINTTISVDKITNEDEAITDVYSLFSIPGFDTTLTYNSFRNFAFQFWKKDLSSMNIHSPHYPDGTYNITVTIANRKNPKTVSLWINGREIGTLGYDKMMNISKEKFYYIGVGDPNRDEVIKRNYLNGTLSHFAIYPEVLGQSEIQRLGANISRSLFNTIESKPIVYYDGKFLRDRELIDLSGNDNHATAFNTHVVETDFKTSKDIAIPFRREGRYEAIKHEENGYVDGYWKTWQSRVNQVEFYKQFYDTKFDSQKEGLNTLYYTEVDRKTEDKVIYIKAALTN